MYKTAKKLSPVALGMVFCFYQTIQLPAVYAASLNLSSPSSASTLSSSDPTTPLASSTDPAPATADSTTTTSVTANFNCPLESSINQSTSSSGQANPATSEASDITPVPKTSDDASLKYQSDQVASSDLGQDVSGAEVTPIPLSSASTSSDSMLMAQVSADDCCGIGGTTTCEVGGLPTGGAALGGLSPLLGMLGLLPAAVIPFALSDGNGTENTAEVPEPSTTSGIVAGFGLMGLWLGRRSRARKNLPHNFSD